MTVIDCFPTTYSIPMAQTLALCLIGAILISVGVAKLMNRLLPHAITEPSNWPGFDATWISLSCLGAATALGFCLKYWVCQVLEKRMGLFYYDFEPTINFAGLRAHFVLICFFLGYTFFLRREIVRHSVNLRALRLQTSGQDNT